MPHLHVRQLPNLKEQHAANWATASIQGGGDPVGGKPGSRPRSGK